MMIKNSFFIFSILIIFLLTGCASVNLEKFNEAYYTRGDIEAAYNIAKENSNMPQEDIKEHQQKSDDLLWQVQAGISGFYANKKESIVFLESADRLMQDSIKNFATNFFGSIGAILTSDNALPYPIYLYEASMVNYYLALESMQQGKNKDARVYLNQALERQNDAKSYYAKELERSQEGLSAVKKVSDDASKTDQYLAVTMDFARNKGEENLTQLKEKYINPIIPYLKFIFELKNRNFSSIASMSADDFALIPIEDRVILNKRKKGNHKKYVWIIIEDGKNASKETLAFSIPLPMNPEIFLNPAMLAVALSGKEGAIFVAAASSSILLNYAEPKIIKGIDFATSYQIDHKEIPKYFTLSDLMITEFNKRLAGIRTRAILRSIPPAIVAFLSEELGRQAGFRGLGFLTSLGHRLILSADVRSVTALPNSFYITRIENTKGEKELIINHQNTLKFSIKNQDKDAIVYIRNLGNNKLFMKIFE